MRTFKSMFVNAKTVYITKGVVDGEILKQLQKRKLDLDIAIKNDSSAEVVLNIERQTVWPAWDYSYRMEHQSSGTVLAAGKVKAIDGGSAAKQIAQQVARALVVVGDNRAQRGAGSARGLRQGRTLRVVCHSPHDGRSASPVRQQAARSETSSFSRLDGPTPSSSYNRSRNDRY